MALLAFGLPVQAALGSGAAAHTALTVSADPPMPDGCDAWGDGASPAIGCPAASCLPPAVLHEEATLSARPPARRSPGEPILRHGLVPAPDPSPPRAILRG
jgi:hypothetical protein